MHSRRHLSLPIKLVLIGAFAGAGLVLVALGSVMAGILLITLGAGGALNVWYLYGWSAWHLEKILRSIETLPIPIAIYDEEDRLISCNKLYTQHHPKALDALDLMNRRKRPSYFDMIQEGLDRKLTPEEKTAAFKDWAKKQPQADGKLVERKFPNAGWLRVGKRRLPDGGTVRVAIEINELKQREADLIDAIEHARRADDMKAKFFSKMTHELRTPLNGIIGMSNVVLLQDLDDKTKRNVEALRGSGVHLLDLVNRILDFSKLNSEASNQTMVDFDLIELVHEVLNEARFSPHADGLLIQSVFEEDMATHWHGNRIGLRQVLTNLVGNAAKFTNRGSVNVHLAQLSELVLIDVIDTGIGIPADQQDRIFNAFEQVDGDWDYQYGGTGLGLTICAEIIDAAGGSISVESTLGTGSRFHIRFPMTPISGTQHVSIAS